MAIIFTQDFYATSDIYLTLHTRYFDKELSILNLNIIHEKMYHEIKGSKRKQLSVRGLYHHELSKLFPTKAL